MRSLLRRFLHPTELPGVGIKVAFERSKLNSTLDSLGQVQSLQVFAAPKVIKEFETTLRERLDKRFSLAYRTAQCAQIAQLVEQRIENPRVAGSIPALGTIFPAYFHIVRLHKPFGFGHPKAARYKSGGKKNGWVCICCKTRRCILKHQSHVNFSMKNHSGFKVEQSTGQ
jgi:hypothetical protein